MIDDDNKQSILDPLPVSRLWGVGKVTETSIRSKGINTFKQLRETPISLLQEILGNQTEHMLRLAQGKDDRSVESDREAKSISAEQTFAVDIKDKTSLLSILMYQVEEVSQRLRAGGLCAKTLTLKLRDAEFHTITRSSTLSEPTSITQTLWQTAEVLFLKWYNTSARPLRLLGFGVSGLLHERVGQSSLFPDPEAEKQKQVDKVFDAIRQRYGHRAVRHGR
jgi:DNA polymerase-4